MFTKLFIFAILGATLALASPVERNEDVALRASLQESLKNWWDDAEAKVTNVYLAIKTVTQSSAKKVFNEIKDSGLNFVQVAKERYEKVKAAFESIKQDAKKAFEEEKKIWQGKLKEAIKFGKETYEQFKAKAVEAIKETKDRWETKLQEYGEQLQDALERIQQHRLD